MQGLLASQHNQMVKSGHLSEGAVIQIKSYSISYVKDTSLLVVLLFDIINISGETIGDPKPIAASSAPPPQQQQPQQVKPQPQYQQPPQQQQQPQPPIYSSNNNNNNMNNNYTVKPDTNSALPIAPPDAVITPLSDLNPYINKWTIKGRITNKSQIRTWSNASGNGQLFSIDLLDDNDNEIRGTFFKEEVDKFYSKLEVNQIYTFSNGVVKPANKRFNTTNSQYEVSFNSHTEICHVQNDNTIKQQVYHFMKIGEIQSQPEHTNIDVIGVVKSTTPSISLRSKAGKDFIKKEVYIVDQSQYDIKVTIWGDEAVKYDSELHDDDVLAIKNIRVSDFGGGKSLSGSNDSSFLINPSTVPEAEALINWYNAEGKTLPSNSLTTNQGMGSGPRQRKVLIEFDNDHVHQMIQEQKDPVKGPSINVKAIITRIKHDIDPWYPACASEAQQGQQQCNRKVTQDTDGNWTCDKCNRTFAKCNYRYILSMAIADHTSSQYISIFDDEAKALLGHDANEMQQLKEQDTNAYESIFQEATLTEHAFWITAKSEVQMDVERIRRVGRRVTQIKYVEECKSLLELIKQYN